jgi:hypothetical protein
MGETAGRTRCIADTAQTCRRCPPAAAVIGSQALPTSEEAVAGGRKAADLADNGVSRTTLASTRGFFSLARPWGKCENGDRRVVRTRHDGLQARDVVGNGNPTEAGGPSRKEVI